MGHQKPTMSDYLQGLNFPAPEPKPELDDSVLFQTTDFFNLDYDNANTFDPQGDNVSLNSNFTSWNGISNNEYIPSGKLLCSSGPNRPWTDSWPKQTSNSLA
jgi:hypothetical protein